MINYIKEVAKGFVDIIYPLSCESCGRSLGKHLGPHICGQCLEQIRKNPKPQCHICGRALTNAKDICPECRNGPRRFDSAHSACIHDGPVREMIHAFKYKQSARLDAFLSGLIVNMLIDEPWILQGIDVVTAVPLHTFKRIGRGYNQSLLLANIVAKKFDKPVIDILKKTRITRNQNELAKEERILNLKGSIHIKSGVDNSAVRNASFLIVDDVMATGSTLDEAAGALKDAGAKIVRCVTISRGI